MDRYSFKISSYSCSPPFSEGESGVYKSGYTYWALSGRDRVPAFQIRWKSSDLSFFGAGANPLTTLPTGQPSGTSSTGAPANPSASPSVTHPSATPGSTVGWPAGPSSDTQISGDLGLSPGKVAGIVIGVAAFAALVAVAITILFISRRTKARKFQSENGGRKAVPVLDGGPKLAESLPAGLSIARERGESGLAMHSERSAVELPAARDRRNECELAADGELPAVAGELSGEAPEKKVPELPGPKVTRPVELPGEVIRPSAYSAGPVELALLPTRSTQDAEFELVERQSLLQERRRRLLELDQIDREEESLRQRLLLLRNQQSDG